jgi:hypothetical protein
VIVRDKSKRKFILDAIHNKVKKITAGEVTWSSQNYFKLLNAEKDNVKRLVHILDANNVSNEFYAELSKFVSSMSSVTCISDCRQVLDTAHTITKTPGGFPGAQVSIINIVKTMLKGSW